MVSLSSFDDFSDTHRFDNPHSLQRGFSLQSPPSPPGGLVIDSDSELGSDPISEVRDRSETGWLHRSTEASPTGESPTKTNQISWGDLAWVC